MEEKIIIDGREAVIEKLPVSKPVPIEKPTKITQLQPIVQPVAVVPFVSFDDNACAVESQVQAVPEVSQQAIPAAPEAYQAPAESYAQPGYYAPQEYAADNQVRKYGEYSGRKAKRGPRVGGFLCMLFSLIAVAPFAVAYFLEPNGGAWEISVLNVPNLIYSIMEVIKNTDFTDIALLVTSAGILIIVLIFLMGLIGLLFGKRMIFTVLGILSFLLLAVGQVIRITDTFNDFETIKTFWNDNQFLTVVAIGLIYCILTIIATAVSTRNRYIEE